MDAGVMWRLPAINSLTVIWIHSPKRCARAVCLLPRSLGSGRSRRYAAASRSCGGGRRKPIDLTRIQWCEVAFAEDKLPGCMLLECADAPDSILFKRSSSPRWLVARDRLSRVIEFRPLGQGANL